MSDLEVTQLQQLAECASLAKRLAELAIFVTCAKHGNATSER